MQLILQWKQDPFVFCLARTETFPFAHLTFCYNHTTGWIHVLLGLLHI